MVEKPRKQLMDRSILEGATAKTPLALHSNVGEVRGDPGALDPLVRRARAQWRVALVARGAFVRFGDAALRRMLRAPPEKGEG